MKQIIALFFTVLFLSFAEAAVTEGENLLVNGDFTADQIDFPGFWNPSSRKNVVYDSTGGLEKKASIGLKSIGDVPVSVKVRQQGVILVPGEKYKLSGYVKTKGCKSLVAGFVLHNDDWTSSEGFVNLPADSDWTFKEKVFTLFPSKSKEYGLAMFAEKLTGEIYFADLKLEALSEKARKGSISLMSMTAEPRLVPLQPLLNNVPHSKAEILFRLFGTLPDKEIAYKCFITIDGKPLPQQAAPVIKDRNILVKFAGLACGDHVLKVALRHDKTQETFFENTYPISVIDVPEIDRSKIKSLNNLVAEVLNESLAKTPALQSFTFVNPRDGWVFIALSASNKPASDLTVKIDDRETVITANTDRLEAFRELPMGEHRITVSGNYNDANLLVHSIPEILDYPPCCDSFVKENGSYGWDFMKKHILYAVTTLDGGILPGRALDEAKARGLRWLANFGINPVDKPAAVASRIEKSNGMRQPQYDGTTIDELYFGRSAIDTYTKALQLLDNPENLLIYTWIVGKPTIRSIHTDFISTALNVARGRGRLLYEAHCYPLATEKAAAAYLDNMIGEPIRRFNAFFPNAIAGTGVIFGNYTQIPIMALDNDPEVDYKYYLDMQVNLIANSPDFKNLATTGYWGTYYGDEEMVRWSFMLMRHYAVEGHRDMLSERYGLKYKPGFLSNGDFSDGTNHWICKPAVQGSISTKKIPGYGTNSQGRLGRVGAGDTVCIMTRNGNKPNNISQTAHGLEVGKAYCLQFVTADYNDAIGKKYNPRKYGIDVKLDGAEILPDKGYVHIDKRKKNSDVGKINLNRIIFHATAPTLVVTFDDEKAIKGEKLMINYVQLKPYLE